MSNLRERYAKAGMSSLQKQKEQQESYEKLVPKTNNSRPGYLPIEEGKNFFRIYPAHVGSDFVWCMKGVHWIPAIVEDKTSGVKKEIRLPVFNSRIHGGLDKDIVEFYIYQAENILRQKYNGYKMTEDDKATHGSVDKMIGNLLFPIKNYKDGIGLQTSWVAYADRYAKANAKSDKVFGRIEVYPKVKDAVNAQAAAIEDADSPAAIDPFSDFESGFLMNLQKTVENTIVNGKTKKETSYAVAHLFQIPLTDEDLEAYEKQDPLSKLFVNSYKSKDLDKAVEGLRLIEKKYKYNVLNSKEFVAVYEEILNALGSEISESEEIKNETNEGDEFDAMDKTQLTAYCRENGIPFFSNSKTTEDEVRNIIREYNEEQRHFVDEISQATVANEEEEGESDLPWDKKPSSTTDISEETKSAADKFRKK